MKKRIIAKILLFCFVFTAFVSPLAVYPDMSVSIVCFAKEHTKDMKMKMGDERKIVLPGSRVRWKTDSPTIVSVRQSGLLKALKEGTAVVTAEDGNGNIYVYNITVEGGEIKPKRISLNYRTCRLEVGDTRKFTATIFPINSTDKTVKWRSSNKKVASVSDDGTVTAEKAGTAYITATSSNGLVSKCKVIIKEKKNV